MSRNEKKYLILFFAVIVLGVIIHRYAKFNCKPGPYMYTELVKPISDPEGESYYLCHVDNKCPNIHSKFNLCWMNLKTEITKYVSTEHQKVCSVCCTDYMILVLEYINIMNQNRIMADWYYEDTDLEDHIIIDYDINHDKIGRYISPWAKFEYQEEGDRIDMNEYEAKGII